MANYRFINRKQREYICGIYKITNPNGAIYIGQSRNIKDRWSEHKRKKNKKQPKLYNSFEKYGRDNHIFEIVHELPIDVTQEILDNYEGFYSDRYKECGINLLNLREGKGRGTVSEETKLKISASLKEGYRNGTINKTSSVFKKGSSPINKGISLEDMYGQDRAEEIRNKIKEKRKLQVFSLDSIRKRTASVVETKRRRKNG